MVETKSPKSAILAAVLALVGGLLVAPARADTGPPPSEPAPAEPQDEEPDGAAAANPTIAWVGFSVAGAGLVTWIVAGSIAISESESLKDDCPEDVCPTELEEDLDGAKAAAQVATAGMVVTVLGGLYGLVAVLTMDDDDDETAEHKSEASASVRPVIGPGYFGLSGQF